MSYLATIKTIVEKSKENVDKNGAPFETCPTLMKIWCPFLEKCKEDGQCYWGDRLTLEITGTCKLE